MKLSIDTSLDSKDDLKKVIQLLQMIVGDEIKTMNLQDGLLPSTDVSGLMSLFDNSANPAAPPAAPAHAEDLTDPSTLPQIEFY